MAESAASCAKPGVVSMTHAFTPGTHGASGLLQIPFKPIQLPLWYIHNTVVFSKAKKKKENHMIHFLQGMCLSLGILLSRRRPPSSPA